MPCAIRRLPALLILVLGACGLVRCAPEPLDTARLNALYDAAVPASNAPLAVYFIGHSLVGRDMPAMLATIAGEGHRYESQLGWGAELEAHWEPGIALNGSEVENDHPRFRDAFEAVDSGDYDVLVMTEKIGIEDSIKYHDSWHYLSVWAERAAAANPNIRLYFYETWHPFNIPDGWLNRIDQDLSRFWEREIIDRALATKRVDRPIYVIPGGQVMARFAREIEARGNIADINSINDLFVDDIHFNSLGAYLMALTHYAVIYGQSPVGLQHDLKDAKGNAVPSPEPEVAQVMQEIVWEVVTSYPRTGVRR